MVSYCCFADAYTIHKVKLYKQQYFHHFSSYYAYATNVKLNHDFDLLIFTQEWPATVCKEWKKHDPSHKCVMPTNTDSWTIHGIWPTKLGTIGPAFCNRTWMFDPEKIKPIEQQLSQVWVNVFGGKYCPIFDIKNIFSINYIV